MEIFIKFYKSKNYILNIFLLLSFNGVSFILLCYFLFLIYLINNWEFKLLIFFKFDAFLSKAFKRVIIIFFFDTFFALYKIKIYEKL